MKKTLCLTVAAIGLATFKVSAATLYVSLESPNPVPPFTNWATAATNIQHAVDAARAGDTVLVTNGIYSVGGRGVGAYPEYNPCRVAVTNAIRLESVNGPVVTTIVGSTVLTKEFGEEVGIDGRRCVYLGANAVLSGFTLTNGIVVGWQGWQGGAGVFCEPSGVVTNCTLSGNEAWGKAGGEGGGAYGGNLYNCTLTGNVADMGVEGIEGRGSAAFGSTLYNGDVPLPPFVTRKPAGG